MIVLDLALGSPMSYAINEINQVFRAVQGGHLFVCISLWYKPVFSDSCDNIHQPD